MSDGCSDVSPLHSAWLDGELDADERARVDAHVEGCERCQRELESLGQTRTLVRNLPSRRVPAGLRLPPPPEPAGWWPETAPLRTGRLSGQRVAAGLAVLVGFLGGAVFALGGEPQPEERVVTVPVDLFVADHLVRTVGGPLSTPVVVDSRR